MKWGLILLCASLISCAEEGLLFEESQSIKDASWNKENKISFDFAIKDTLKHYDFYCNLRTTSSYEWANLYLFVNMESPNDMIYTDTVELPIADKAGKWYGKNSGSIVENSILFFKNVNFDLSGKYTITFTQAMRTDNLNEVTDVGLKIKEVIQ